MCNLLFTLLNGRGDDMDFRESEIRPFQVDVHGVDSENGRNRTLRKIFFLKINLLTYCQV